MLRRSRLALLHPHRPSRAGVAVAAASLALATALAAFVHVQLGVSDAAIVYLLAVVAVGMGYGSWMAVATSVASFLLYDFFFVRPLYTFSIDAPEEWLDLLLFLFVAIAIGRLSALQLQRRREAELRSAEARAMFAMSRDIATAASALEAAPLLAARLAREAEMARVWIGLGATISEERVVADTGHESGHVAPYESGHDTSHDAGREAGRETGDESGHDAPHESGHDAPHGSGHDAPHETGRDTASGTVHDGGNGTAQVIGHGEARPSVASRWTLHSTSADGQPSWAHVRDVVVGRRGGEASVRDGRPRGSHDDDPLTILRVPITSGGETIGSLWAARPRGAPFPGRSHSRLMAAAADQLGQSVVRDRLAAEATAVEVARQGDALKSALLDSVSHDLRTPLSAIRAAAGNLMDPDVALGPEEQRAIAASIDLEAQRLSRLVRNMLDLGRIEGGALRPSPELYDLADLVDPVVERIAPTLASDQLEVRIADDLPAVQVDAIFVDQILTNLLENAARYAGGKRIVVSAKHVSDQVWLDVEDAGPGVPASAMPRLFERFYRGPRRQGSRSEGGSGIGLAVVRGLTEAMGGSVMARPSALGGLEVIVRLPVEYEPKAADLPAEPADSTMEGAIEPTVEGAVEPAAVEPAAEPTIGAATERASESVSEPATEGAIEPAPEAAGVAAPETPARDAAGAAEPSEPL